MVQYWIHPALFTMVLGGVLAVILKNFSEYMAESAGNLRVLEALQNTPLIYVIGLGVGIGLMGSLIASVLMGAFVATLRERHL